MAGILAELDRDTFRDKKSEAGLNKFKVTIRKDCWNKMFHWCDTSAKSHEVSGMGLVKKIGDWLHVYDVFMLPQTCARGGTRILDGAIDKKMMELAERGIAPKEMRFWWHTHCDFEAYWSHIDVDNARRMVRTTAGSKEQWFLSLVLNSRGEYRMRFDINSPIEAVFDGLEFSTTGKPRKYRDSKWQEDIDRFVEKPKRLSPYKSHEVNRIYSGMGMTWSEKWKKREQERITERITTHGRPYGGYDLDEAIDNGEIVNHGGEIMTREKYNKTVNGSEHNKEGVWTRDENGGWKWRPHGQLEMKGITH